jgi:hypothetical protein
MKTSLKIVIPSLFIVVVIISSLIPWSCRTQKLPSDYPTDTIRTNLEGKGWELEIIFTRGTQHNHPLMAIWVADTTGKYLETLYIAESIGKGVFSYGDKSSGKWLPGPIRRPAALPVWAFSRNVREEDGLYLPTEKTPIPDAITGATPKNNFVLVTHTSSFFPEVFRVYFEINQPWDWNKYWTNGKYPGDKEYESSCQPAIVYMATIDTRSGSGPVTMNLIGHSHYDGANGEIDPDLSTITTAKEIASSIKVKMIK